MPMPCARGGREGVRTPLYRDGQQGYTGSAPQVAASLRALPPRGYGTLLWFVPAVWGASEVWRGWRSPVPPLWAAGALAPRGHHNNPEKLLSGSVGLFTPIRAGAHCGVPVAGAVQRVCGRGPRSRSPHCLGAARPLRWHRARPRGLCLRWGHAGAPAGSVRGGCLRGLAQAGWAGGSQAPAPSLRAGSPGSDCPEQGSWGALSPLCAPQSCGGRSPLPVGRSAGWTWVPSLARAPRGSGHGDRDLAGAWAAGAGGTPWLCAPLPTSHEVPCLPSPGVPARVGLGGVGAAVLCLSFLRASCGCARWPRGAGCWPSVALPCPAGRVALAQEPELLGGHGEPIHTLREAWGCYHGETEARGSS